MSDCLSDPWYILIQWNDNKKDRFTKVLSVLTNGRAFALATQETMANQFLMTSWMHRSNRIPAISRDTQDNLWLDPVGPLNDGNQRMVFSLLQVPAMNNLKAGDKIWIALHIFWDNKDDKQRYKPIGLFETLAAANSALKQICESSNLLVFHENKTKKGVKNDGIVLFHRRLGQVCSPVKQ